MMDVFGKSSFSSFSIIDLMMSPGSFPNLRASLVVRACLSHSSVSIIHSEQLGCCTEAFARTEVSMSPQSAWH